jgi:hypothetical protein
MQSLHTGSSTFASPSALPQNMAGHGGNGWGATSSTVLGSGPASSGLRSMFGAGGAAAAAASGAGADASMGTNKNPLVMTFVSARCAQDCGLCEE